MKNIVLFIMLIALSLNSAFAGTFKADARTKRIPAGTVFQLEFLQPVGTYSG